MTATTIDAAAGVDLRLRTDANVITATLSAAASALAGGSGSIRIDDIGSVTIVRAGAAGTNPSAAPGEVRVSAEGDLRLESALAGAALLASAGGSLAVLDAASGADLSLDAAGESITIGRASAGQDVYLSLSAPIGASFDPVIAELAGAGADAEADLIAGTSGTGGKLHMYRTTSADGNSSNNGRLHAPGAGAVSGQPLNTTATKTQVGNATASAGAYLPTVWTLTVGAPQGLTGEQDLVMNLALGSARVSVAARFDFTNLDAAGIASRAAQALRAANLEGISAVSVDGATVTLVGASNAADSFSIVSVTASPPGPGWLNAGGADRLEVQLFAGADTNNGTAIALGAGGNVAAAVPGPVGSSPATIAAAPTLRVPQSVTFDSVAGVSNDLVFPVYTLTAGSQAVTLNLSVQSGTLSASNGDNVTVTGSGASAITLSGTASALNAFLSTAGRLQYAAAEADQTLTLEAVTSAGRAVTSMALRTLGNSGSGITPLLRPPATVPAVVGQASNLVFVFLRARVRVNLGVCVTCHP